MADKGYILLHRKIQDCTIWTDAEPFDRRSAWLDLLMLCNHSDVEILFNGNPTLVGRGQYLTSVRKLSEKWHWSKDRTLRYLRLLESLSMIHRESDTHRTLITIVNYGIYQDLNSADCDTDKDTHKDTDKDTHKPQTINVNKLNKLNKLNNNIGEKTKRFIPPTLEEVKTYCSERKNSVNPENFINFYESKGWYVGKNKMKDWKAAVRTWEHDKNSKGGAKVGRTNGSSESDAERDRRDRETEEYAERIRRGEVEDESLF